MRVRFSEILKNKLIYGLCTVLEVSKAPELLTQLQTIRLQCNDTRARRKYVITAITHATDP